MAALPLLRRSIIVILAYLAGFLALVLVQFSGRDRFKASAGAISISGISLPDAGADGFPISLTLSFEGIGFSFGSGKPVAVETADGSGDLVRPIAWAKSGSTASVSFERGVTVDFESGSSGESFSLHTRFGDSGVTAVSLPYSLSGASFQANLGERLSVKTKSGTFSLGMPEGSRLDAERFTLTLGPRRNAFSLALVRKPARAAPRTGDAEQPPQLDERQWKADMEAWLDKCWAGLSRGRYSAQDMAWLSGGAAAFSDEALAVLIAESLKRGVYADIRSMVAALSKARADALGWRSSVYLGDIIKKAEAMQAADRERAAALSTRIASRDASVLLQPGLVHFCADRSPSLLNPLLALAGDIDPDGMGPGLAAGVLMCLDDAEEYFPQADNPFARLESAALSAVTGSMAKTPSGAFFLSSPGESSLELQARLGMALVRIGRLREDAQAGGAGRAIMSAAVSLADERGLMPATVSVAQGAVAARSGILVPEAIYGSIAENPWYPRPRSLFREAGAGAWILSCAPRLGVEWSASQAILSADWPVGATHYMIAFDVDPIVLMRLYEIPYNPDPAFDRYNASGYLYSRASRTLFLKMKHKSEREYVRMNF